MGDYKYHSALKIGLDVLEDVEPLAKARHGENVAVQNDIIKNGLPIEMSACDIIYGECPWPQGFKVFDERAGVLPRGYKLFQEAVARMVHSEQRPVYLILGQLLLNALPQPRGVEEIKLNKGKVMLAWWNDDYQGPLTTNVEVTHHLGGRFSRIGDFCCGYGEPLFSFLDGGGVSFVGADHNGKCIRVLGERMKERFGEDIS